MRGSDALGRFGERVAAAHLREEHGWPVLARNWRSREGELDIVARDGATLVVCEVKTRAGGRFGSPAEAVTPAKLRRLRVLALRWLETDPAAYALVRVDVVAVVCGPGHPLRLEHLQGVGS